MKQGAELKKACDSRAIHLEWVLDLTVIQFLSCLRRFVSSRGTQTRYDYIRQCASIWIHKDNFGGTVEAGVQDKDVLNYVPLKGIK